ncbi:rho guanine nucleotide exchange factor 33-like [Sesbania bispinosa]|nr:rho guanine nucleotide exchange factor 33-like [Sesbania bispinosa]
MALQMVYLDHELSLFLHSFIHPDGLNIVIFIVPPPLASSFCCSLCPVYTFDCSWLV